MSEKITEALFGEGGLLRVRAVLTFGLAAVLCWLTIDGVIDPEVFLGIAAGAVGYYFGTRGATPSGS